MIAALENEAVFVVINWASEKTSKYTEEPEFLSCCLLAVTTVARRFLFVCCCCCFVHTLEVLTVVHRGVSR